MNTHVALIVALISVPVVVVLAIRIGGFLFERIVTALFCPDEPAPDEHGSDFSRRAG